MLNSSRRLGGSIGLAVLTTIAAAVGASDGPAALSLGYFRALLVGGGLIALCALLVPRPVIVPGSPGRSR